MYTSHNNCLTITRNTGGFFSCCSIRLESIIAFYNKYNIVPLSIDSSIQFDFYKTHSEKDKDVCPIYFIPDTGIIINLNTPVIYSNNDQFKYYNDIDYNSICYFVRKYFSPSQYILNIIHTIEKKYNIDYTNTCVLFFRGNDKILETVLPNYNEYIENARIIKNTNPSIKFLVQSDETEFIDCMINEFKEDVIVFRDEIRHIPKRNDMNVDGVLHTLNNEFSKYFLAIIIIMSKCKYVICNTGNCSLWIMLYREGNENTIQLPKK